MWKFDMYPRWPAGFYLLIEGGLSRGGLPVTPGIAFRVLTFGRRRAINSPRDLSHGGGL